MKAQYGILRFKKYKGPAISPIEAHNERDAGLPLGGGPYYRWETFRDYCKSLYE